MKLHKLDIEAAKIASIPPTPQSLSSVIDNLTNSGSTTFNMGKHIALVPNNLR